MSKHIRHDREPPAPAPKQHKRSSAMPGSIRHKAKMRAWAMEREIAAVGRERGR